MDVTASVVGGAWRERLLRRVSGRPGAEGAVVEGVGVLWVVGWEGGGAMRRAFLGRVSLMGMGSREGGEGRRTMVLGFCGLDWL